MSWSEAVIWLLRSLLTNREAFEIAQEVFATIVLTWISSFNLALVGKALKTWWFLRKNNSYCLGLCQTFGSLRRVLAGTNSFSNFLWAFFPDSESLSIVSEFVRLFISSWASCANLSSICKAFWSVGLSASNVDLWRLRFGKYLSFLRVVFTGSNTIIYLLRSLLTNSEAFNIT